MRIGVLCAPAPSPPRPSGPSAVPASPARRGDARRSRPRGRPRDRTAIADRLSRDLGRYRRGLPDLLVSAQEADESDPGFELWEAKGPGDQLRAEEKGWIDYLEDVGIPARVAKVRWISDN